MASWEYKVINLTSETEALGDDRAQGYQRRLNNLDGQWELGAVESDRHGSLLAFLKRDRAMGRQSPQ